MAGSPSRVALLPTRVKIATKETALSHALAKVKALGGEGRPHGVPNERACPQQQPLDAAEGVAIVQRRMEA
jgi:hypothetical protein